MTADKKIDGQEEAESLNPEIESLLWNQEELSKRIETFLDATLLTALHAQIPSPADVSADDYQRFGQFISRYQVVTGSLREEVGKILRNPDIRDAKSIAAKVKESMDGAKDKMREYAEIAKTKGNGVVLSAIEKASDAFTEALSLHSLQEDVILTALDKIPSQVTLQTAQFFTIRKEETKTIVPKAVQKRETKKESKKEDIPEFKWSWTDEELLKEEGLPLVTLFNEEQFEKNLSHLNKEILLLTENWARNLFKQKTEIKVLTKGGFPVMEDKFVEKAINDIKNNLSEFGEKMRDFSMIYDCRSLKRDAEEISKKIAVRMTFMGANYHNDLPSIISQKVYEFLSESFNSQYRVPIPKYEKFSKNEIGIYVGKPRRDIPIDAVFIKDSLCESFSVYPLTLEKRIDTAVKNTGIKKIGEIPAALHEATAQVRFVLVNLPINSVTFSDTKDYIAWTKEILAKALEGVEKLQWPDLSEIIQINIKNAASLHITSTLKNLNL